MSCFLLFSSFDIPVSRNHSTAMKRNLRPSLIIPACLALLIAACAPVREEMPAQPSAERARQLAADNRHTDAARQYFRLAEKASGPKRHQYALLAAAELLKGGYSDQAQNVLLNLPAEQLGAGQGIRRSLLLAEIALEDSRPDDARAWLEAIKDVSLEDPQDRRRWHHLRVEAFAATGQPQAEMQERIALIPYLADEQARLENLRKVVEISLGQPEQTVEELLARTQAQGPLTPELAQRIRMLRAMMTEWGRGEAGFLQPLPAMEGAPSDAQRRFPSHIGMLLPLSGRFAQAGEIIRDGLMAMNYATAQELRPVIEFHDTGDDKDQAWQAYQQAIAAGAKFVIGPLSKDAVTYFSLAPALPVPVLALNYSISPLPPPPNFYQFGLSPEDEAMQAAIRAWQDGYRRPVVLTPDNAWGQRIAEAFRQQWQAMGAAIVSELAYGAESNDFSPAIRQAFELDHSDKRHRRLQQITGLQLKFSTRRRQDVDFVFIAAQPRQARLLRPQLKFYYAGDLPIYSTSHIFSGTVDPGLDRDMNGIIFGDIPWVANRDHPSVYREITRLWPQNNEQFWRLYALGIDALALSASLRAAPPELHQQGEAGLLSLDPNRRIVRELTWAQFRDGAPRPFAPLSP